MPLPVPVAPAVMLLQLTLLVADQMHPGWVVTLTVPASPSLSAEALVGERAKMQDVAAA